MSEYVVECNSPFVGHPSLPPPPSVLVLQLASQMLKFNLAAEKQMTL